MLQQLTCDNDIKPALLVISFRKLATKGFKALKSTVLSSGL